MSLPLPISFCRLRLINLKMCAQKIENINKMKSSKNKEKNIDHIIAKSGFPFQKEIEKLILSYQGYYYPHQIEVPLSVPTEYATSKFIPPSLDMALCYAEHPSYYPPKWSIDLLVECKKAFETDWYFFSKLTGSYYKSTQFPISASVYTSDPQNVKIKSIFFDCTLEGSPIEPPVCDNALEIKTSNVKGEKNEARKVIYEACGTLSLGLIHFLDNAKQNMRFMINNNLNGDDVTIVFPLIVTTANLHIIDSEKLSVDLDNGKLDVNTIKKKPVDWLLFEVPIATSLQVKSEPGHVMFDFAKELATKMGCVIVKSNKLIYFLDAFRASYLKIIAEKFLTEEDYNVGTRVKRRCSSVKEKKPLS